MLRLRCCLVCLLAGCAAVAGEVILEDDFGAYPVGSAAAPLWDVQSGRWQVTADGLLGSACEGHFAADGIVTGRAEWTDYVLTLRFKMLSRGADWRDGPWIGFRHRDRRNGYTLGFYNRLTALHKIADGRTTDDTNPLAESPVTVKDNDWHRVRIELNGATIRVTLDERPLLEATDADHNGRPPVPSGGIVLAARQHGEGPPATQVLFDDVRVEALGAAPAGWKLTLADARALVRPQMSMLQYLQSRAGRRFERVPRKVLAFYYTWYGNPETSGQWVHWQDVKPEQHDIASSTHYPALGAYDSHDPKTIETHIRQAKASGIDAFVCTWWGQGTFDDRAFAKVLDIAGLEGFEVTVYWETAPGKGTAQVDRAVDDLLYILRRYGSHPAFLKVDGKPVIFIYGRVMGEVPFDRWPDIVTRTRDAYGGDFLLIADGYSENNARAFDGTHVYNVCGWVQKLSPQELRERSRPFYQGAVATAKRWGRIAVADIIPGYDDTKIRKPGINAERQGGDTYRVLWEEAIAADPDWVIITSWNEWHEGSEIEPSHEDGDLYLTLTAEYAARFKQTPYSAAPIPATGGGPDPKLAEQLRALYRDRAVALLPDYGSEAVLWLADSGVAIRELTWEDLLDPGQFNPAHFPVTLFGGGEGYVQTLHEEGDVDRALVRYLEAGGLLVVIPNQPFPFYYNQAGKSVVSAGRFGFPIAGSGAFGRADVDPAAICRGWEQPPAGVTLSFAVDSTLLPGVPGEVPWPATGDLRWRPANRSVLPDGDVYLSLAELRDAGGKSYGDGIAYIEHRVSPPRGGKCLYVWMRMPELLGRDATLFGVFRLAAEKALGP